MSHAALSRAERSYILDGLSASPAQRQDGRSLTDFRPFEVESSSTPQADGSARVLLGSTEVVCGIKAEVEAYQAPRVSCESGKHTEAFSPWLPPTPRVQATVEYSPALLHEHSAVELSMITSTVQDMLSGCFTLHSDRFGPLLARQFIIVPYAKYWTLHIDVYVLSWSGGNVLDALFAAVSVALWNTWLPGTKMLAMDTTTLQQDTSRAPDATDDDPMGMKFITRGKRHAAGRPAAQALDFALEDEWDEGHLLDGRDDVPVCISVYPVRDTFLLDPTLEEESALSISIAVLASASGRLYGVRQRGDGEVTLSTVNKAIEVGMYYARQLAKTLTAPVAMAT
ncbi:hypothetical protein MOBT1_001160 [Malassezia obtusa]|uniref:Ribosomal RNA-processing protein 42 n=1 Tax=Malassezia obtusa TaxID=76774 RepID=A0AAF0IRI5_9BASI|nr:hypothetical protein MOBT1_001160 [Malassezia obtusa]